MLCREREGEIGWDDVVDLGTAERPRVAAAVPALVARRRQRLDGRGQSEPVAEHPGDLPARDVHGENSRLSAPTGLHRFGDVHAVHALAIRGSPRRSCARAAPRSGVDNVDKALRRASGRVAEAGVEMRLVRGDVTALRQAGVAAASRSEGFIPRAHWPPAPGGGCFAHADKASRSRR